MTSLPMQKSDSNNSRLSLARMFSIVHVNHLSFLIMEYCCDNISCPQPDTIDVYLSELTARNVTDVVRVCDPSYDKTLIERHGIPVHDWGFPDGKLEMSFTIGQTPPQKTLDKMISLCEQRFGTLQLPQKIIQQLHDGEALPAPSENQKVIAIHCVAGLGRAPVMVGVVLIEAGIAPLDAVSFIRKCRRGALNSLQLHFLADEYKRKGTKKSFFGSSNSSSTSPNNSIKRSTSPKGFVIATLSKFFAKKSNNANESPDRNSLTNDSKKLSLVVANSDPGTAAALQ